MPVSSHGPYVAWSGMNVSRASQAREPSLKSNEESVSTLPNVVSPTTTARREAWRMPLMISPKLTVSRPTSTTSGTL